MATPSRQIELTVIINGEEKVLKTLGEYQEYMKQLSFHLQDVNKRISEAGDNPELLESLLKQKDVLIENIKAIKDYVHDLKAAQIDINSIAENLKGAQSVTEMRGAKRALQNKGDTIVPDSAENIEALRIINQLLGEQNFKLKEAADAAKQVIMPAERLKEILRDAADPNIGASLNDMKAALAEVKRQMDGMKTTDPGCDLAAERYKNLTGHIEAYKQKLKEAADERKNLEQAEADNALWDKYESLGDGERLKVEEYKELEKAIARLKDTTKVGTLEYEEYEDALHDIKNVMGEYRKGLQEEDREAERLAVAEEKRNQQRAKDLELWNKYANNESLTVGQLQELQQAVARLIKEETLGDVGNYNMFAQAQRDISAALGEFNESAKEAEKEAKKLQEAQEQMIADADAFNRISFMDKDSLAQSYTINELKELDKALERHKGTLSAVDDEYKDVVAKQNEIRSILGKNTSAVKKTVDGYKDWRDTLKHIDSATVEQLKQAQKDLTEEISKTNTNQTEYYELAKKLREVNSRIHDLTDEWKDHKGQIEQAVDRVKTYMLVYVGWGKVMDAWNSVKDSLFEISDLMSDIQKRTKMAPSEVKSIGDELNKITEGGAFDSRLNQEELYGLAATAGLLGLKSKQDILGFTEAANYAKVALVELGDEGAAKLMKIATVTGDVAKFGVQEALTKVSSSINELTASSAASAGPIVEFVSRVGAVGSTCGVSMSEVAGLGATLDALGQKTEMSATSMNKILYALKYNHRGIAAALGMDPENLEQLVYSGQTMEALIQVIERMKATGGDIMPFLGEMNSEKGARLKQTLSTLVQNASLLREQVRLSNEEFEKGTSVINEYNVKNENAAAYWERAQNNFQKAFTSTDAVDFARGIAKAFYEISLHAENLPKILLAIAGAMTGWKVATILLSIEWTKLRAKVTTVGGAIKALVTSTQMMKLAMGGLFALLAIGIEKGIESFGRMADKAKEAMKDVGEWFSEVQSKIKEMQNEADKSFGAVIEMIKKGKTESVAFADAIDAINSKYRDMIGYTLSHVSSLKEVKAAQDAVNAAIEEGVIKSARADQEAKIRQDYATKTSGHWATIEQRMAEGGSYAYQGPSGTESHGNANAISYKNRESMRKLILLSIDKMVEDGVAKGISYDELSSSYGSQKYNKALKSVQSFLQKELQNDGWSDAVGLSHLYKESVLSLVAANREQADRLGALTSRSDIESEKAHAKVVEKVKKQLDVISDEYKQLIKDPKKNADALVEKMNAYMGVYSKNAATITADESYYKEVAAFMQRLKKERDTYIQFASYMNQFGSIQQHIGGMSGDTLYRFSKKLREEWDRYSANADWESAGLYLKGEAFGSAEEANEWIAQQRNAIAAQADKLHIPRPSDWQYERNGAKEKNPATDEMAAMLAMLEEYYTKRKTIIEEARVKEELSEGEYNRQIQNLETEHLTARTQLRSEWLDVESKEFKYMSESLWKDEIGYTTKQLNTLRGNLKKLQKDEYGKTLAEVRKKRAEDWLKIQEDANKHRAALEKALLDGDQMAKMVDDLQKSLDQLDLIFGMSNDRTDVEAQRRILIMRRLSKEMSRIFTVDDMRKRLQDFGLNDLVDLDDDHIRVLMDKLNNFSEQYDATIKSMASKSEKLYAMQMRSGEWDRMAAKYLDEMLAKAIGMTKFGELDNADFVQYMSDVVVSKTEMHTREQGLKDANAESLKNAVLGMFNSNPTKDWNVSDIRRIAYDQGGQIAEFIASIEDEEIESILASLKKGSEKVSNTSVVRTGSRGVTIMERMMKELGLTANQSAGIAGNLFFESSGLKENARNSTGHYGLAQWDKNRRGNFKKVMKTDIVGSSFDQQVDFVIHELRTTYKHALDRIKNSGTVEEATRVVDKLYEVSEGTTLKQRNKAAKDILAEYNSSGHTVVEDVKTVTDATIKDLDAVNDIFDNAIKSATDANRKNEEYAITVYSTITEINNEATKAAREQMMKLYNDNLGLEWTAEKLLHLASERGGQLAEYVNQLTEEELVNVTRALNDYRDKHQSSQKELIASLKELRKRAVENAALDRTYYDSQDQKLKNLKSRSSWISKNESVGNVSNYATSVANVDVARQEFTIAREYVDMLQRRYDIEKAMLVMRKAELQAAIASMGADHPERQEKINEMRMTELKLSALEEERLAATSKAMEDFRSKSEALEEANQKLVQSALKEFKAYNDTLNTMMNSISSAGSEHSNLTALAEISAKKRLGIAVDTTKQEYLIYSRSGKAIRQMMNEEEKLRWDMDNDARNQRLDAVAKWLDDWGKKMSDDITNAFANRVALQQKDDMERQELERAAFTADARKQIEGGVTQARQIQLDSQLSSFKAEQDAELEYASEIAKQRAALGPSGDSIATNGASATSTISGDEAIVEQSNGSYSAGLVNAYATYAADTMESLGLSSYAEQVLESMNIIDGAYRTMFDDISSRNTQTTKEMTNEQKQMTVAMCQAANIYGVAYNAVMNENLSVTQKMGMIIIQSMGQVLMTVLTSALSMAIADNALNLAEAIGKCFAQLGPWGWVAVAGITGAIGASMALATKAVTKSKNEISALTGAASGKKVAAGMLTYAEGNYPVLGSDGEVYDAKRETNWKTKVYSSPHYGILGEKGPELIVDGITTRKMMTLRPDLYQDILDLAHGRQMVRAKAYAEGNYPAMPAVNGGGGDDTNAMLVAAISQLNAQLAGGIKVAALGEDGAVRRLNEAERWMEAHGLV